MNIPDEFHFQWIDKWITVLQRLQNQRDNILVNGSTQIAHRVSDRDVSQLHTKPIQIELIWSKSARCLLGIGFYKGWESRRVVITTTDSNKPLSEFELSWHLSEDNPGSKVHGANMGLIWGRQDPGGPHATPWILLSENAQEMRKIHLFDMNLIIPNLWILP